MAKNRVVSKLSARSMDEYCTLIERGVRQCAVAKLWGCAPGRLSEWISQDPERSARAHQSRLRAAEHWDFEAENVLRGAAPTMAEVARAKELAQHFRWRASKIAPATYGEKLAVEAEVTLNIADRLDAARKRLNEG